MGCMCGVVDLCVYMEGCGHHRTATSVRDLLHRVDTVLTSPLGNPETHDLGEQGSLGQSQGRTKTPGFSCPSWGQLNVHNKIIPLCRLLLYWVCSGVEEGQAPGPLLKPSEPAGWQEEAGLVVGEGQDWLLRGKGQRPPAALSVGTLAEPVWPLPHGSGGH